MAISRPVSIALRSLVLLGFGALPAVAATSTYDQLRASHPAVAWVVGQMPGSGLNAELGHVSSLLAQPRVASLPPGPSSELPNGFENGMAGTLDRLNDDLELGLAGLSAQEQLTLMQVLDLVAVRRNLELHQDGWSPCDPSEPCENAAVIQQIDRLAGIASTRFRIALSNWERLNDRRVDVRDSGSVVTSRDVHAWILGVVESTSSIMGVESIDD